MREWGHNWGRSEVRGFGRIVYVQWMINSGVAVMGNERRTEKTLIIVPITVMNHLFTS